MARAYSEDLRERFCRALARGMSARAAARQLEVSASTGVKWAQQWRSTGMLSAKPMGGCRPVVLEGERDWLLARLERQCDRRWPTWWWLCAKSVASGSAATRCGGS